MDGLTLDPTNSGYDTTTLDGVTGGSSNSFGDWLTNMGTMLGQYKIAQMQLQAQSGLNAANTAGLNGQALPAAATTAKSGTSLLFIGVIVIGVLILEKGI